MYTWVSTVKRVDCTLTVVETVQTRLLFQDHQLDVVVHSYEFEKNIEGEGVYGICCVCVRFIQVC